MNKKGTVSSAYPNKKRIEKQNTGKKNKHNKNETPKFRRSRKRLNSEIMSEGI